MPKASYVLRAIADEISEIALTGDGISRLELKRLHAQLSNVYELIGGQTVFGMETSQSPTPKAAGPTDTYSDGTPVSIVVGPPSSRGWSAPGDVYDCGIPWLPNTTATTTTTQMGPFLPDAQ